MDREEIRLTPVGEVAAVAGAAPSAIRLFPEYLPGLHRLGEHSHAWILCWFHEAERGLLQITPGRDPGAGAFGVFGLRTPVRPNPIALTAVRILGLKGDLLQVEGLDARPGTPVLDIKPYFGADIIFSARTPYVRSADPALRRQVFRRRALAHHGEACPWLEAAVAMAMLAEAEFGQIQAPDLTLTVAGPACLADSLQGLTRARLANPPRFSYRGEAEVPHSLWQRGGRAARISLRPGPGPGEAGALNLEWVRA